MECEEGCGTIVSETFLTKKATDTFDVEFKLDSNYKFISWKAYVRSEDGSLSELPSGYIGFSNNKLSSDGIYTVTVNFISLIDNIVIKPVCVLVPKITKITPAFSSSGCDQDSTIEITFSKNLDPESFGDFSCISIKKSDGTELFSTEKAKSYFDTPYFSSDCSVLNIPTVKGKLILPSDSADSIADITLIINYDALKDADGFPLTPADPYTYRVNRHIDEVKPVITDIHLYSTSDTSDYFYKELTDKPFTEWSSATVKRENGNALYQNGDFSRNHVSRLYITLKGYDKDSGLKRVKIKETYKKDTADKPVTEQTYTKVYSAADFESEKDTEGNTVHDCKIEYSFASENPNDGLYLIQVSLVDMANNEKTADYWVIKDTYNSFSIDTISVGYLEASDNIADYIPIYNSESGEWETGFPFRYFSISVDTYYSSSVSQRLIYIEFYDGDENPSEDKINKIFTGMDIGNQTNLLSTVKSAFSEYRRNPQKTTNISVRIKEESGITGSITVQIPKSTHIAKLQNTGVRVYDMDYKLDFGTGSFNYYTFYTYQSVDEQGNVSEPDEIKYLQNYNSILKIQSLENGIYNIYVSRCLSVKPSSGFRLYSAFEKSFTYYKGVDSPYSEGVPAGFEFPEFTLPEDDEINYERNTGMAKFTVGVDYFEKSDYSYSINFGTDYVFSKSEDIEVENGKDYEVYISAIDSDGNFIGKSNSKHLSLKNVDNIPPYINTMGNDYPRSYIESGSFIFYQIPQDKDQSGNWTVLNDFTYYLVPESYGRNLDLNYLNSGLFQKGVLSIIDEDINAKCLNIPFDGISYGNYYVYFYLEDTSPMKNYSITCGLHPVRIFTADTQPSACVIKEIDEESVEESDEESADNEVKYKIKISLAPYTTALMPVSSAPKPNLYTYDKYVVGTGFLNVKTLQNNEWSDYTDITSNANLGPSAPMEQGTDGDWIFDNLEYESFSGKFIKLSSKYSCETSTAYALYNVYSKPAYIYPDYYKYLSDYESAHPGQTAPAYCNSKNWVSGGNGYQIFADRPCFVHTCWSSRNLTASGDLSKEAAYEWEARAQETGIIYNDGTGSTFSYTSDNLADIPKGAYYTTIAHFADGTVLMSEVKQK